MGDITILTFLFADGNMPFAVAIAIVVIIAGLEAVGLLMGAGLSDFLDGLIEGPDGGGVDGHGSMLSAILSWLRIGQVPILILLIVFLTAFGVLGYALQGFIFNVTGYLLPSALASLPALFGAVPAMRWMGGAIAAILPSDETSAVATASFVGLNATITLGTARKGSPAQARLKDAHGQSHYVMVEPEDPQLAFAQGDTVRLTRHDGARFLATAIDINSLKGI